MESLQRFRSRCEQLEADTSAKDHENFEEVSRVNEQFQRLEEEIKALQTEKAELEERLQDSVPISQCTDLQTRILELEGMVSTNDSLNPSMRKARSSSALSFSSPLFSPTAEHGIDNLFNMLRVGTPEEAVARVTQLMRKMQHLDRCRRLYERLRAGMLESSTEDASKHISTQKVLQWYLALANDTVYYRTKNQKYVEVVHELKSLLGVKRAIDLVSAVQSLH